MQVFFLVLNQMAMMALLILVGLMLRKIGILPENTGKTLSKLETFALVPALTFNALSKNCTVENFKNNYQLIFYGAALCIVAVVLSYPLSKLFVRNHKESDALEYQRSVYKYGLTFGNYGFIGEFIILGVFGDETYFKYKMFTLIIGIVCSAWGLYVLIPKGGAKKSIWRNLQAGLLAPPTVAVFLGIICGLLNVRQYLPEFFIKALDSAGGCMGPIAMILAGTIIGGYKLKKLLFIKKVYVLTFLRLIVIPAVFVLALKLLGVGDDIVTLALITYATPLGMNSIVYPAAYGGDTESGASMVVVSSTLSIITIPVMYYLLIELL